MDLAIRHRANAGRHAVREQVTFFREQFASVASDWKADDSRVTFADFAISERIFTALRGSFPEDNYCSEESNPADEALPLEHKYTWVLDPIDGTNNYFLGLPFCAISLALLKNGMPVYGLIYEYGSDRLLEGGPGIGIWDGHRKLEMLKRPFDRKQGVIGLHFPLPQNQGAALQAMLTTYRVRSTGSGALNLAYTALGVLNGTLDFKVKIWDIAASCALIEAVGLPMVFLEKNPFPLKEFHVDAPLIPYYAGSADFCDYCKTVLG